MFNKIQKNVGDVLEFPPDVIGDVPKITLIGRKQILVENFLEIIAFSREEIRISTNIGELLLVGKDFVLQTILATELKIEGELNSLSFEGRSSV